MTYSAGGPISASDYNAFITSMNQIFADTNSGATTYPTASYGYGQTPTLTSVSEGAAVSAAKWAELYDSIRTCGTHQGTTVVPPLPASNPDAGSAVEIYSGIDTTITDLTTNRFVVALGQASLTSAVSSGTSAPWTNSLTYTFEVNLGSWDNARYFFNAGGYIGIAGSYPGSGFPTNTDDYQWYSFLNQIGTIKLAATSTTSNKVNVGRGFWNTSGGAPLTTSYQQVYSVNYGGAGYYSASTVVLNAKLAAGAGLSGSGTIQLQYIMSQADTSTPAQSKALSTTLTMSESHASNTVVWPGSATITPGSFIRV